MEIDLKNLPDDSTQLKKMLEVFYLESHEKIKSLENKTEHWQLKYETLLESFKIAQQHRYGASSEKNSDQDDLFDEADAPIPSEDEEPSMDRVTVEAHERQKKHPKRSALPEHFPREDILIDVDESDKVCVCGCQKECFGESISEQLDVVPPQLKVLRYVRPKYVCKACEGSISIAPSPCYSYLKASLRLALWLTPLPRNT